MKEIEVIAVQVVTRNWYESGETYSDHTATVQLSLYDRIIIDSACGEDMIVAIWKAVSRCFDPQISIDSVRINTELCVRDGERVCTAVLNEIQGGSRFSATGRERDSVLLVAKVVGAFYNTKNVVLRSK